jgi:hypothetical protein
MGKHQARQLGNPGWKLPVCLGVCCITGYPSHFIVVPAAGLFCWRKPTAFSCCASRALEMHAAKVMKVERAFK